MDLQSTAQAAVDAPRFHCDGAEPIQVESRAGEDVIEGLEKLGHEITKDGNIGGPGHVIRVWNDGSYQDGGTDPRGEGKVISR